MTIPNLDAGVIRKAKLVRQERVTGYSFGVIDQARDDFAETTRLSVTWNGGGEDGGDDAA